MVEYLIMADFGDPSITFKPLVLQQPYETSVVSLEYQTTMVGHHKQQITAL